MTYRGDITHRIWLSFSSLVLIVGLLIAIVYPLSIKGALTEETYRLIEQEQDLLVHPNQHYDVPEDRIQGFIERQEAARSIGHVLIVNQFGEIKGDPIPDDVLQKMGQNAFDQQEKFGRYELSYGNAVLFYVIRKNTVGDDQSYFISYMWDTYRNEMVQALWIRLVVIVAIAYGVSLLPAMFLTYYLRRPLKLLGERFEQIAKRNWKESFRWDGDKDFKQLSDQFETMRQNLMRYDRSQKTFMQHASHELKTPIMVIKSYAQSVKDGIYPKGSLEQSMDVLLQETERMEKRVKDMIYYTKLDALKDDAHHCDRIVFRELAHRVMNRFAHQCPHIQMIVTGEEVSYVGDEEQWETVMENLLQNAMRYATSVITLHAETSDTHVTLSVENDGEAIAEEDLEKIFTPFQKGTKGQFGLGLAIVRQIVTLHGGTIEAKNVENGVAFVMTVPFEQPN